MKPILILICTLIACSSGCTTGWLVGKHPDPNYPVLPGGGSTVKVATSPSGK